MQHRLYMLQQYIDAAGSYAHAMQGCVQHTCCATMFAAPVAAAFALSRSSRLASLSNAHTVPLPLIKATTASKQL